MGVSENSGSPARTVGLLGATGVGVGAIVGGGILVLAGVAFQATGPSALLAFGLNGLIAVLTALSYAEMSTAFPESGGTYTFANKVLSVRAAFVVGWVLWLAYIVAAVLYAEGFAEYALAIVRDIWGRDRLPAWLLGHQAVNALAVLAAGGYAIALTRKATGGGELATIGKVLLFLLLVLAGLWTLLRQPSEIVGDRLSPFFPHGGTGLLQAMGYTFIALQGFDLIPAIAGEIKDPERTIPRAMLLSLGVALVIYLPLLFLVSTVGVGEGQSILQMSQQAPETVMAVAVSNYLGAPGYWLVMIAAVLSTLSALQANILAASRVVLAMAHDRTLPRPLERLHSTRGTPYLATSASAAAVMVIVMMITNLGAAGAAASLIFLISFGLAHWTSAVARPRISEPAFRTPLFPLVPVVGGGACVLLAIFQGVAVPGAGLITLVWLGLGAMLYFIYFGSRAEAMDAFAEAHDPDLVRLRGRNPLVLVPVANPASAPALVAVANALAPPDVGRVLLLSVMVRKTGEISREPATGLLSAQQVLTEALKASLEAGHAPEALMTIAPLAWAEIRRVAGAYRCESLLVGMSRLTENVGGGHLEQLLNEVECDVAILQAPNEWRLDRAMRIVVPVGGRGRQQELRARLLGSLCRTGAREVTFLRVVGPSTSDVECEAIRQRLVEFAADELPGQRQVVVARGDDPVEVVRKHAEDNGADLVVLGLQRLRGRKLFGEVAVRIAEQSACATIMLSRRR